MNQWRHLRSWGWLSVLLLGLIGCSQKSGASDRSDSTLPLAPATDREQLPVHAAATSLPRSSACSHRFITHTLEHTTQVHGDAVTRFETNGAGVAINDLNQDGWLDVVLANLNGPATILWNEGNLVFRAETLPDDRTRAVNIVDVDGDGWLDVVFTHIATSLSLWHNTGVEGGWVRQTLPGVMKQAHAMAWGDVNRDGALDLVTGSYDAELGIQPGSTFLLSDGAGVFYYEHQGDQFVGQRLAQKSQTLVIALFDVNGDAQTDILVGNDFDMGDMAWVKVEGEWLAAAPFTATSQHTMNFDWADIDNNGSLELFATDMNPYDISVAALANWLPMMATMTRRLPKGDPQIAENVLQVQDSDGQYHNEAERRGISATGWSWSGKFGDFDQDGWVDLYVVNGMIDADLFAYLPQGELVEENQALRNLGNGNFAPATEWNLGSSGSGRGLSLADLDNDGDLDMVVNNLRSPAQLFENQLCQGTGLEVELRWSESGNRYALGAQLLLHTSVGTFSRDVRASSGYLSGDPVRVHFGLPDEATVQQLEVIWPDGLTSTITEVVPQTWLTISR